MRAEGDREVRVRGTAGHDRVDERRVRVAGLDARVGEGGHERVALHRSLVPGTGPAHRAEHVAFERKQSLAQAAVSQIKAGSTVFFDAGSTNLAIANALSQDMALTAATNAPAIAAALLDKAGVNVILIGGQIDRQVGGALGAKALRDMEQLSPDLCVLGACGVAINSAPTEGVPVIPLSQIKATFPALKNPANRHKAVGFTHEQWQYAFTNGFPEDESRRLYERYHVPASGSIFWESAFATITPGHQGSWVDYHNADRAPLLFISGADDHLMPPSIQRSNAKHYNDRVVTEVKEFEGPHLLPAWPGWETVADYALEWALEHAAVPSTR